MYISKVSYPYHGTFRQMVKKKNQTRQNFRVHSYSYSIDTIYTSHNNALSIRYVCMYVCMYCTGIWSWTKWMDGWTNGWMDGGCVGGGEAFFSVLFSVMPGYYLI